MFELWFEHELQKRKDFTFNFDFWITCFCGVWGCSFLFFSDKNFEDFRQIFGGKNCKQLWEIQFKWQRELLCHEKSPFKKRRQIGGRWYPMTSENFFFPPIIFVDTLKRCDFLFWRRAELPSGTETISGRKVCSMCKNDAVFTKFI